MVYVALAIVALLALDIVIAMPTLTLAIMAGYFLGSLLGAASAAVGMTIAGLTGYGFCRFYGPGLLASIYRNPSKLEEVQKLFNTHGAVVLLMCRAMPILPEVACCMAGASRMPIGRFVLYYMVATLPYACIAAYAGARSSLEDPTPAIGAAIAMTLSLWIAWLLFLRRHRRVMSANGGKTFDIN